MSSLIYSCDFLKSYLEPGNSVSSIRSELFNKHVDMLRECGATVDLSDPHDVDAIIKCLIDCALVAEAYPGCKAGELMDIYTLARMKNQKVMEA